MSYDLAAMIPLDRRKSDTLLIQPLPPAVLEADVVKVFLPIITGWLERVGDMAAVKPVFDAAPDEGESERTYEQTAAMLATLAAGLSVLSLKIEQWHRSRWVDVVLRQTGMHVGPLLLDPVNLGQIFTAWSTSLIRTVNDDIRGKIATAVRLAALNKQTPSQLARTLRGIVNGSRKRVEFIARDQLLKYAAQLTEYRHREAGIKHYVWRHSHLPNPREHHLARDGKKFAWNKPPVGGHPGHEPNCRCYAVAVIPRL